MIEFPHNEMCDDRRPKVRVDQYAGHSIVSNFQLHRDSHLQIQTVVETLSAPTWDTIWLVCHLLIDRHDFSYLLYQHCRFTSLRIIEFPCIK